MFQFHSSIVILCFLCLEVLSGLGSQELFIKESHRNNFFFISVSFGFFVMICNWLLVVINNLPICAIHKWLATYLKEMS